MRDEKCIQNFVRKSLMKRPLGRPRRIILELILLIGWKGVDWIHMAQDSDQCWVVNTVMKLRFP
jgi:hypothetical protein